MKVENKIFNYKDIWIKVILFTEKEICTDDINDCTSSILYDIFENEDETGNKASYFATNLTLNECVKDFKNKLKFGKHHFDKELQEIVKQRYYETNTDSRRNMDKSNSR